MLTPVFSHTYTQKKEKERERFVNVFCLLFAFYLMNENIKVKMKHLAMHKGA